MHNFVIWVDVNVEAVIYIANFIRAFVNEISWVIRQNYRHFNMFIDVLEPSPNIRPSNTFQLNGAKNVVATTDAYKPRPRRSELTAQKPNREERLQWPGSSSSSKLIVFPP